MDSAATMLYGARLTILVLTSLSVIVGATDYQKPLISKTPLFDWSFIRPSRHFHYTSCYNDFQCTRLDVPLNWNDTENLGRAAIAIIRLPAKVPVTDPRYGGAILVNPGGPGESGVDEVINRGHDIQTIVDTPHSPSTAGDRGKGKYFDIISFDPRGVKNTTPALRCFSDAFKQQMWLLSYTDYGFVWQTDATIGLEFARVRALSHSCREIDREDILRYVNTAQVVEDMIEIVEQHGQWRQAEADYFLEASYHQAEKAGATTGDSLEVKMIRDRAMYRPGKEKLQYWGISYGTLLGQTFAAMHPDRVGRMVIDGVLDPDDYYRGEWLANLQDSDMIMKALCRFCFDAGPDKCPMYAGSSAEDIERGIEELVFSFRDQPMAITDPDLLRLGPHVVTYRDVYLRAIGAMYAPFAQAEAYFQLLAEVKQGNFSHIVAQKAAQMQTTADLANCGNDLKAPTGCFPEGYFGLLSSTPMIECMDSASSGNRNITVEDFKAYFAQLTKQSNWFATSWARHRLSCVGMKDEPAWKYEGAIASDTSHPLLIVGNSHDTVTPIGNARQVSELFPRSVVLQHDSEGHCSHANPSTCTAEHIRNYFQTGELPEPGTLCQPDYLPFVGYLNKHFEMYNTASDDTSKQDPSWLRWEAQKRLARPKLEFTMLP